MSQSDSAGIANEPSPLKINNRLSGFHLKFTLRLYTLFVHATDRGIEEVRVGSQEIKMKTETGTKPHTVRTALFATLCLIVGAWGRAALTSEQALPEVKPDVNSPLLTSWFTHNSGRYARVVEQTGASPTTTWPSPGLPNYGGGQSKPAYADIQQVHYSSEWVYVTGTGLASHQMGPWYAGMGRIFGNWPSNQSYIRRFPRHPKPADTKVTNGLGDLGIWVNGVALFNMLDGAHYDTAAQREAMSPPGGQPQHALWVRNAVPVEGPTFDKSNAHQPEMGTYHYHSNPLGLRYQLGDNVSYDRVTDTYREASGQPHHSPILGWAYDGYPIYGPYGYSEPKNAASPVRRMVSGYVLQDSRHHTTDLRKTGRRSLAKWAADLHNAPSVLTADQTGPDVSIRYPLGRYCEDYAFLGDLGATQGKDFDMDLYNGRFCVTPEFPQGTYAYFVTLNEDGSAAFPYVIGRQYYGVPSGGNVAKVDATATVYRSGGAETPIRTVVTQGTDNTTTITWSSMEGGHYSVQASGNGGEWKTVAANVPAQGTETTYTIKPDSANKRQFRVTLASLDSYDNTPPGNRRGPGGPGQPGGPPPCLEGPEGPDGPPGPNGPGLPPGGTASKVTPNVAQRGATVTLRLTLDGQRLPPDFVQPSEVRVGALKAKTARWDGETVTANFVLPAQFATGKQNIVIVFPGPPGTNFKVTFTGKSALTVR